MNTYITSGQIFIYCKKSVLFKTYAVLHVSYNDRTNMSHFLYRSGSPSSVLVKAKMRMAHR